MAQTVPLRREIPLEHTWNSTSVFSGRDAWAEELREVAESLSEFQPFSGTLADGPVRLADALERVDTTFKKVMRLYVYASMFQAVDTTDQEANAMNDQAIVLYGRTLASIAFVEPEILGIGQEKIGEWMDKEPRLAPYAHYFEELFDRQAHVRSSEVEEVLGMVADPFVTASGTHGILADADLTFRPAKASNEQEVPVAQGNIDALLADADRETRRTAWESYSDAHLAFKNTFANCLAAAVKQNVFTARARRYSSALEAALVGNHIPAEVFHNLLATYKANLPTWHRYWAIRRRALGYERLHVYDIKAPLTSASPKVPYEQSIQWIVEGMRPLGADYVANMERGLRSERWVDIYPNQGKRAGAFSSGSPGTHPFILMSYTDDLDSMSTLAHELGHSMHSYLTWQNQPMVYSNYSMFVAEVASNFNQAMVRAHLFEHNTDRDFQIALIEEAMSNFHRYFFIMPTLARFELELHERVERGEGLTADSMIALMTELFREGYGDEVDIDAERIGITWAQFQHLYMNFYVFQYATGISGANALAARVLAGETQAAEQYISFLSAGSSLYPLDALKLGGVDLTTPQPVEQTFEVLAQLVDRLDQLTG